MKALNCAKGNFMVYVFFIIGLALLVKGADWLVSGASATARKAGVSDLFIGLTIVAFGTSSPELFVNIFASIADKPAVAIGNVVGSNIINILLILGLCCSIFPLTVKSSTVYRETPFATLAPLVLFFFAADSFINREAFSFVTRSESLAMLSFFGIFLFYVFTTAKNNVTTTDSKGAPHAIISWPRIIVLLVIGFAALFVGSKLLVDSAVKMAAAFGVSESLISLTIVAMGTSLPELATSAVAAFKKNADISVGNIIGSNIFNVFFILAISGLVRPLPISANDNTDILAALGASVLLFFFMFTGGRHKIDRWEGILMLISYIAYTAYIVNRG